jgi:hypothetical protein
VVALVETVPNGGDLLRCLWLRAGVDLGENSFAPLDMLLNSAGSFEPFGLLSTLSPRRSLPAAMRISFVRVVCRLPARCGSRSFIFIEAKQMSQVQESIMSLYAMSNRECEDCLTATVARIIHLNKKGY